MMPFHYNYLRQAGLSLVELMVAILIGLIILAGVIQVVASSKSTYIAQEEMSFIQENARYALDVLTEDIQEAGYWGCAGDSAAFAQVATANADQKDFLATQASFTTMPSINGFEGTVSGSSPNFPLAYKSKVYKITSGSDTHYPDSFIVRSAGSISYSLATHSQNAVITTKETHHFNGGDYLSIISGDCRRVAIVKASSASSTTINMSNWVDEIKPDVNQSIICEGGSSMKCNGSDAYAPDLIRRFLPGAVVAEFESVGYFIGESSVMDGVPALKKATLHGDSATIDELALGVYDMEVLYGVDTNADKNANRYLEADDVTAAQWASVVSMQISLLFRSNSQVLEKNSEAKEYLGKSYEDRYLRRIVSTTVKLRSRS